MSKENLQTISKPTFSYRWLNLEIKNWPPQIINLNCPRLEIQPQCSIVIEKYIRHIPQEVAMLLVFIGFKKNWQKE